MWEDEYDTGLESLSILRSARYHLYTIWLFTFSDMKTILFPTSIWGLFNALSGPCMTTNNHPVTTEILCRIPLVILWVWLQLLPFNINNQRRPEAIAEDSVNKPWRPLVAGRLSPSQATYLMCAILVLDFLVSFLLQGFLPCLAMFFLGHVYNYLGGADNIMTRNLINGLGFQAFGWGATLVASNSPKYSLNQTSALLFSLLGVVVLTTVQSQDMHDQEGDQNRGRRTLPLVIGDGPARWTLAIGVIIWSFYCPFMSREVYWTDATANCYRIVTYQLRYCLRAWRKWQRSD
ncbi:digeranylgeranylglyceryl phosphate synthase protein [Rutstroemia sp. NJR-2017a WRK4]|nr:digeranylgeranylglyceryl phosphate synthase protein [Rutstroemia sp. NJR-2017a WRK4]